MNALWLNSFLVGCEIDSTGASAIAEYLKLNSSLTQLDLNSTKYSLINSFLVENQIKSSGASGIAESLKLNSSLTKLYLRGT